MAQSSSVEKWTQWDLLKLNSFSFGITGFILAMDTVVLPVIVLTVAPDELKNKTIAIPGQLTTAALLLRLFDTQIGQLEVMPFDKIMGATARGEVDAGVIIHESRFTYPEYGLEKVIDLGEWWEQSTGHPIPLGGILARRSLGAQQIGRIDRALKQSVEYAYAHPDAVRSYIQQHAQEMDEKVIQRCED